ncbi:MAG: sodium:solute symporter family transporter, partial [Solirubrobacteraceae bacterium]
AHTAIAIPPHGIVPVASGTPALRGEAWARPVGGTGRGAPVLVYSLLVATFLGTMGLPHVLVRFYTNPDGHAARHTTVRVLGLLSLFYLFPAFYGALGRALAPVLYVRGQTDDVVLALPHLAWPGLGGTVLTAVTCAGAFAAFLSTSSGLLVSVAGTVSHDVWPRVRHAVPLVAAARRRHFRVAAACGMVLPALLALVARQVDISILVGWAFAIAASTFCPMFLLGIWWSRLTARAAGWGMTVGMVSSTAAIFVGLAMGEPTSGGEALLQQPAIGTVPLAFLTMVCISMFGRRRRLDADAEMLTLHAPEGLGLRLADETAEGALA